MKRNTIFVVYVDDGEYLHAKSFHRTREGAERRKATYGPGVAVNVEEEELEP